MLGCVNLSCGALQASFCICTIYEGEIAKRVLSPAESVKNYLAMQTARRLGTAPLHTTLQPDCKSPRHESKIWGPCRNVFPGQTVIPSSLWASPCPLLSAQKQAWKCETISGEVWYIPAMDYRSYSRALDFYILTLPLASREQIPGKRHLSRRRRRHMRGFR